MLYYINIQNGSWGWDINQVSEQVLKPDIVPVGTVVADALAGGIGIARGSNLEPLTTNTI